MIWTPRHQTALGSAWETYRTWAKTARRASAQVKRTRTAVLFLTIGGGLLAASAQQVGVKTLSDHLPGATARILGAFSALSLAIAAYFSRELLGDEEQRRWVRSRALAEAAKSEIFLYRSGIAPYDTSEAPQELTIRITEMLKLVEGLWPETISGVEIAANEPTAALDLPTYITERIDDQMTYYGKRVTDLKSRLGLFRMFTLVLGGVSVALGVLALADFGPTWIAFLATATATLGAYAAAERYGYLVATFSSAGEQLKVLKVRWQLMEDQLDQQGIAQFIRSCEAVISAENGGWIAKQSERKDESNKPVDQSSTKQG